MTDALMPSMRRLASHASAFARNLFAYVEANAWVSYALIFLLNMKILWGIWLYRDLTTGDTSSYFLTAYRWSKQHATDILWSPLYTSFYGEALSLTHDIYAATILHRVAIVLLASVGVLAVMRRLLPPGIALLIAVWWSILPINHDTLYEVHLFGLLPMLVAFLIATTRPTSLQRGMVLAALLVITVLVRNEVSIAMLLFAIYCLFEEYRAAREDGRVEWRPVFMRSAAYLIPLAAAAALILFFYSHSIRKFPDIREAANVKHTLNMCQVYAFGHIQRHPELTFSPWTECGPLMQQTFGSELPRLSEMMIQNPAAVARHFWWNLSLLGNGLQVALFNSTSGAVNPDYADVSAHSTRATWLSLLYFVVVVASVPTMLRHRRTYREYFLQRRSFFVLAAALLVTGLAIVLTQRPRPSYLFSVTVCLMAVMGLSLAALTHRFTRQTNAACFVVAFLALLLWPGYYGGSSAARPLYANYLRLQPFAPLLTGKDKAVLIGDYAGELANYLRLAPTGTRFFDYSLLNSWDRQEPLCDFLQRKGVSFAFLQPRIIAEIRRGPETQERQEPLQTLLGPRCTRLSPESERDWALVRVDSPQ